METAIVVVATLVAIGASIYMLVLNNLKDLKDNWPVYRCNPAYMPFAGLVGQDTFKNFTDCTTKSFQDYTGFVVDPIMAQFSTMTSIVSEIDNSMSSMRGMMGDTRRGFLGIVGMVFSKIQNLMSQFQYIIIRMRTLVARLVGIMMSFMYIFYAGMETGPAVMNGPVGKTMNFLCFDPETMVELENGTRIRMADVVLGMKLKDGSEVLSVYSLNGEGVKMYALDGVVVSGAHKVLYNNRPIKVGLHPNARYTISLPALTCLNTSTHRIKINNTVFLDFIETTDPLFIRSARDITEVYHNVSIDKMNENIIPIHPYASGFTANTLVALNGESKPIYKVKVGDVLDNQTVVRGIVKHNCFRAYYGEVDTGITGHLGSWVLENGKVRTIESYGKVMLEADFTVFYNLITDTSNFPVLSTSGKRYMVLDELRTTHWFIERFKNSFITSVG